MFHLCPKSRFRRHYDDSTKAKRSTRTTQRRSGALGAPRTQTERPSTVHNSLYMPDVVHEAVRKIAFDERVKIHDLVIEGIDAVLRRRGYPPIEKLKARRKR